MTAIARRSARVLVFDDAGRVLLLRFAFDPADDPGAGHFWCVPGGGRHDGESLAEAAARELAEEVGLVVEPRDLGEPVAFTRGFAELSWTSGMFRDEYFACRAEAFAVDASGMEALEAGFHLGHRWWSAAELEATDEIVYPYGLAGLVADLAAGHRPPEPRALPWHR